MANTRAKRDLSAYDEHRPAKLPGWARAMCRPLLFDADLAATEYQRGCPAGLAPFAVFFADERCDQLANEWAFLALDEHDVVHLVDDEGPREVGPLEAFLASLQKPARPVP